MNLRVVILGSDIAGSSLYHGISQYPHINTNIYEHGKELQDDGAPVTLLSPAATALGYFADTVAQQINRTPRHNRRIFLAQGEGAGELVFETSTPTKQGPFARADVLQALRTVRPFVYFNTERRLDDLHRNHDGSTLVDFEGGWGCHCDIVIGADGPRSKIRQLVLGEEYGKYAERNTGWWKITVEIDYERARVALGEDLVSTEDPVEYGWIGDGTFTMHQVLQDRGTVQISVFAHDSSAEDSDIREKEFSATELEGLFVNQDKPHRLMNAIKEILCIESSQNAAYIWEHPSTPTYINGPLCIIGEAAHMMTPWQTAADSMCIEDSMILTTLLSRTITAREARLALKVYNQIRLKRTQDTLESSRTIGKILTGREERCRLDPAALKDVLSTCWATMRDYDIWKHRQAAINMLKKELGR